MCEARQKIPIILGKDFNNNIVIEDLTQLPHLLVSGSTGTGKSNFLSTVIVDIIYKCNPSEVKLILVDTRKTNFKRFSKLPHLLIPVITEPQKVVGMFAYLIQEMSNRYKLFKNKRVDNIEMEKKTLKNEIEKYLDYYYGIKQYFDIYKYIKENTEGYSEETQQIAFFLKPILVSLLNSTLLDISKIVDRRNEKNLNKLIDRCRANVVYFCNEPNNISEKEEKLELFNKIKEKLEENNLVIENLNTYRDVYLAHTDKKYFMDSKKLYEEHETKYEDIEEILKVIGDSLNKLLYSLCEETYVFNDEYKEEYIYILKCIKECRENQMNQCRKQK